MSGRGGGRGRGGGGGGRGPGGGRSSGGTAGRGQPFTPAARTIGDVPISFGSLSHFPALGSSSAGSGSARPVLGSSSAAAGPAGPSRPVVRSSSGTSGSAASAPDSVRQLEKKAQKMAIAPRDLPKRPGFGIAGTRTVVKANHFLVKVADSGVHQYDVSITPEVKLKKVKREIMKKLQDNYKTSHLGDKMMAFDGEKIVYTAGALPFTSIEFVVALTDTRREREFKVAMKFAARVNVAHLGMFFEGRTNEFPQSVIQALDVVLRETPSNDPHYEVVGRSFFDDRERGDLGNGVEYWRGYYQSLRPTQKGLSLNIDVSATGFYQGMTVSEFVGTYLNLRDLTRGLSDQDRIKVKKVLRNVRVEVTHTRPDQAGNRRRYKITDLTTLPLTQLSFSHNGADTTIVRYFFETYNYRLQHTALPALVSGNAQKLIHLPMEVCKIVQGQKYPKKLNERQVTALLDASCQRPVKRESGIQEVVTAKHFRDDELLNHFGFDINTQLTSVNARVLDPPKIKYHESGRESLAHPTFGQWNMINKKMVNGGRVDKWLCVNFSRNVRAGDIYRPLIGMCREKGMVFNPEPAFDLQYNYAGRIKETLHDLREQCKAKSMRPQLLIIILPDISGQYGTIKRICETDLGVVSQCLNPRKASRPNNQQYFENVALKINVKVGGRNSVLQQAVQGNVPLLTDRRTIIFGADVTHPQPGEDAAPSIASVVASMDWPEVTKYRSLVSAQPHRQEIIQDLSGMIRDHIQAFSRATGKEPERIIFYRDGVSEGQFNDVLLNEVDAIRKACISWRPNYLPRVTFIVVQKRHHTRLFPANHGDRRSADRSGNILPGTVVDTDICHPTEFDFYLCSHAGIKGTSRPTHYHVLYDENECKADQLQMLTYHLCYTYARCTRAVSIVPPAYYAHLAAYRARYYVEGLFSDSGSQNAGRAATREQEIQPAPLPAIKDSVKECMFYC